MISHATRIIACSLAAAALAASCLGGCSSAPAPRPNNEVFRFEVQDRAITDEFLALMNAKNAPETNSVIALTIDSSADITDEKVKKILEESDGTISSPEDLAAILKYFQSEGFDITVSIAEPDSESDSESEEATDEGVIFLED